MTQASTRETLQKLERNIVQRQGHWPTVTRLMCRGSGAKWLKEMVQIKVLINKFEALHNHATPSIRPPGIHTSRDRLICLNPEPGRHLDQGALSTEGNPRSRV